MLAIVLAYLFIYLETVSYIFNTILLHAQLEADLVNIFSQTIFSVLMNSKFELTEY